MGFDIPMILLAFGGLRTIYVKSSTAKVHIDIAISHHTCPRINISSSGELRFELDGSDSYHEARPIYRERSIVHS